MSKTNYLQAVISDLQRTAGPYRCAMSRLMGRSKTASLGAIRRRVVPPKPLGLGGA
jgi:hypothetical protein